MQRPHVSGTSFFANKGVSVREYHGMSRNARATFRSFYGHGSNKNGRATWHDNDLGREAWDRGLGIKPITCLDGQLESLNLSSNF